MTMTTKNAKCYVIHKPSRAFSYITMVYSRSSSYIDEAVTFEATSCQNARVLMTLLMLDSENLMGTQQLLLMDLVDAIAAGCRMRWGACIIVAQDCTDELQRDLFGPLRPRIAIRVRPSDVAAVRSVHERHGLVGDDGLKREAVSWRCDWVISSADTQRWHPDVRNGCCGACVPRCR